MRTSHRSLVIFLFFIGALLVGTGLLMLLRPGTPAALPAAALLSAPDILLAPESLIAQAAVVYDPTAERVLFSKNAGEPLPLASLTKLMAAATVLSATPEDASVIITADALKQEGDSGLIEGESWLLHDLLLYGLVASSNDAMAAAVSALGEGKIEAMNAEALRLGLTQTYFLNGTGLDLDTEIAGAYGSARDIAILAASFMKKHPAFFEATTKPSISLTVNDRTIVAPATAAPLQSLSGFIGAKTGYTDLAGGNLVAAFDISVGRPLILVVLGSTREGRFEDIQTLITAARDAFSRQP